MRSKALIVALLLALCVFAGCWDKRELEDHTFVIMLGLDKSGDDLIVTVAYPVTQTDIGGGESQGAYAMMSAKGPTVAQAMSLFGTGLAGPLSLFSTKTLVISEELARDDALHHIFSSDRYEQMRNNTNVLITSDSAAQFIAGRIENPAIDPLRQEDLLLEQANYSALYRPMQLLDFMVSLRANNMDAAAMYGGVAQAAEEDEKQKNSPEGDDAHSGQQDEQQQLEQATRTGYLPGQVPLAGQNSTQISGLAVFSGNRMVGALDTAQTQALNMLTRSTTRKILSLPDPHSPEDVIVVSILPTRNARVRAHLDGEQPTFEITARLRGNIEHIRAGADYDQDFLTEYVQGECAHQIEQLLVTLQKQYSSDLLGLGGKLARNFATVQEWESYGWRERYPEADIRIQVELKMESTGL